MNFKAMLGKCMSSNPAKPLSGNDQLQEQKYVAGDVIPPGRSVGDVKIIPQGTEIRVTDVKTDSGRHTFVFAVPADGGPAFGWTSAMNLEGGFKNETVVLAPAKWDSSRQEKT